MLSTCGNFHPGLLAAYKSGWTLLPAGPERLFFQQQSVKPFQTGGRNRKRFQPPRRVVVGIIGNIVDLSSSPRPNGDGVLVMVMAGVRLDPPKNNALSNQVERSSKAFLVKAVSSIWLEPQVVAPSQYCQAEYFYSSINVGVLYFCRNALCTRDWSKNPLTLPSMAYW